MLLKYTRKNESIVSPLIIPFTQLKNALETQAQKNQVYEQGYKKILGKDIINWIKKEICTSVEDCLDLATAMFDL